MSNGRGGRTRAVDKALVGNSESNHSSNRSRNSDGSAASTGHTDQQQPAGEPHARSTHDNGKKHTALQEASTAAANSQQQVCCCRGVSGWAVDACKGRCIH